MTQLKMETNVAYYRRTKLSNLEIGTIFHHAQTDWELVYTQHAIMIGLTVEEHDGKKRVGQFSDDELVLIKIQNPINNA